MDSGGWLTLFFIILIFLVCREIICWYWKINEISRYLKEIRDILKKPQTLETVKAPEPANPEDKMNNLLKRIGGFE